MVSVAGKEHMSTLFLAEYNDTWKLVMKSLVEDAKMKKTVKSKLKRKDAYVRVKYKKKKRACLGKAFTPPDKKVRLYKRSYCHISLAQARSVIVVATYLLL